MVRRICAGVLFIVGLVLALMSLLDGHVVIALALAMAAVYVGIGVVIGVTTALENPGFKFAAAFIGLIGIVGVFMYSRGLNPTLASAHTAAMNDFLRIDFRCHDASKELLDIQEFGIKACALQNNSDQMASVVDLTKALHLGPTSSLADSAISRAGSSTPDYCAVAFVAAEDFCQTAFPSLSSAEREALNNAANSP